MYESAFGFTDPPFQLTPDPSFYFDSRNHRPAREQLRSWLSEESGFIVVTGEIGAGKTTLVRTLLAELNPGLLTVAHIVSTQLDADDLLGAVSIGFGIPLDAARPQEVASKLRSFLAELGTQARRAVLIIDEAQHLQREALDRLVAFATKGPPQRLPLQVWLVGQPELRSVVDAADSAGPSPFVSATCHLGPIDREDTGAYIEHRLRKVGWNGTPRFEAGAFDEIFRWTRGLPRRINLLCNRLLLSRFLASGTTIDVATVEQVAREFGAEIGDPEGDPPSLPASPLAPALLLEAAPDPSDGTDGQPRPHPVSVTEPRTFLCVVSGYSDHIKAAAFMRAHASRADAVGPALASATLVRVHDNDALAFCGTLYTGLNVTKHMMTLNIAEGPYEAHAMELMTAFGAALDRLRPKAVIVFDGTQTALGCSTVARARDVPIVHVGAGLRLGDAFAAEDATRRLTDHLADVLFTTDAHASQTLLAEGVPPERVHFVGNLAMDAVHFTQRLLLSWKSDRVGTRAAAKAYFNDRRGYALVVLSNPINMESRGPLTELMTTLLEVSRVLPLVWPMRTRLHAQLKKYHLETSILKHRVRRLPALPYVDYVVLLRGAACVLTDSWNVQEEANGLGIPCLAFGAFPERPIAGAFNLSVGRSRTLAISALWEFVLGGTRQSHVPPMWDGRSGARIAGYLSAWLPEATSKRRDHRLTQDRPLLPKS